MILRISKILFLFFAFLAVTGATAYLTLTWIIKSEDTVVVPDLVGKEVVYALEMLTDLGLNTKVKGSQYSEAFPKNHIIVQEPGPGSEIKKGRDVGLYLSKGTKTIVMPVLLGLSSRQARLVVEENGLCLGQISGVYADTEASAEEVVAQTPAPSKTVTRGECVNLLVTLGPRPRAYRMSSFEGLSMDEAVVLIEKSHLQVGRIRYDYAPAEPEYVVIDQVPRQGYRVFSGQSVELIINKRPGAKETGAATPQQSNGFFTHKLSNGFLKKHVKVRLDSFGISSEVVDEFMEPGEELWLLLPTNQISTLFVYEDGTLVKTHIFSPR